MMYFSCRKPHHSCYLHCVKETPSSPFTEVGEGKTPQTGLARIRTFPGFTLDCVKNLASAGAMQLIWLSFSQSEERLRCPAGLGGVPGQPVLSCTAPAAQPGCAGHALIPERQPGWLAALPVTSTLLPHTSPTQKDSWPGALAARPLQAVGVADEFVQHVDDLSKFRPVAALLLPAV